MSATSHPKFGDAAIPADLARRLLDEAIAVLLPGMGQVFNGTATRGLMMVFSMLTLGWVSDHLTTPEHSALGRYAGGVFIYAVSILDAYRWARYRWEIFHRSGARAP